MCHYNLNLVTLYYFIFISVIFLFIKLNIDYIYLDTVVNIHMGETHFHGDYIQQIAKYFGDVAAFSIGARLASALITKNGGLAIPTKIGIMVGSGASHMTVFHLMRSSNQYLNTGLQSIPENVSGALNIEEAHITVQHNIRYPNLSSLLGNNISGFYTPVQPYSSHIYTYEVQGIKIHSNVRLTTTDLLNQLSELGFNPYLNQINSSDSTVVLYSPLEDSSRLVSYLLESLNYHLILSAISLYLLMMLSLILISKFYFVRGVNIGFLNSFTIFK